MDRADQALYAAKQAGRNQVKVADMTAPAPKQHTAKPEASKPEAEPV
jgi:predicted signal transduction protein with EAL and GGDEF domain